MDSNKLQDAQWHQCLTAVRKESWVTQQTFRTVRIWTFFVVYDNRNKKWNWLTTIFICGSKSKMSQRKAETTKGVIMAVPVRAGHRDSFTFAWRCRWLCCKMDSDALCLARLRHRTGYSSTGKTWKEETSHSSLQRFIFLCLRWSFWLVPKNSKSSTHQPGQQTRCRFSPGDHCLPAVGAQSLPRNIMQNRSHYHMCHWGTIQTHLKKIFICPQARILRHIVILYIHRGVWKLF